VNLFTAYTFSEGMLKGLKIGGGYLHQSKLPVGLTPEGELRYGNSYWDTNAMIGYRFADVPWLKRLQVQLNVSNVFDEADPYIYRYQSNTTVIRQLRVREPRTWKLSASFEF
jgi:outer membrane receptor for monomeric catechols